MPLLPQPVQHLLPVLQLMPQKMQPMQPKTQQALLVMQPRKLLTLPCQRSNSYLLVKKPLQGGFFMRDCF